LGLSLQDWQTWANGKRKATDCFADIVRLFSADYEDASPHLYVTKQAEQWAKEWIANRDRTGFPIVAINPGAGHPDKRWPMDDFLEVAKDLAKRGFTPLFIFGPKENELHQSCAAAIKNQGFLIYKSDNYQVQPLAGILRHCSMLITNDCAVMHIGAAIGCIVLAIFGPTNPDVWFPYSKPGQIAIGGSRPQKPLCPFPTVSEIKGALNQILSNSVLRQSNPVWVDESTERKFERKL
jgi:ADP-heptose:LPS heptosyltransferase